MRSKLLKHLPVATALYAICVFGSATAIAQISAANNPAEGIWVKLCATGTQVFIPLNNLSGDEEPAPAGGHSQACHACADRRIGSPDGSDGDSGGEEDIAAP